MSEERTSETLSLPPGFWVDRGTHINTEDGTCHVVILRMGLAAAGFPLRNWLFAEVIPDNQPSWAVFTKTMTEEEVLEYVNRCYSGWLVRRSGLDGLRDGQDIE